MRPVIRRWLGALGAVTAVAGWLTGQGGAAEAAIPASPGGSAVAATAGYLPPEGILRPGMHGAAVRNLQRRLARLHYYPGRVNGRFGTNTLEAVWAFKEVQGLQTRSGPDDVGPAMEQALARPRPPRVLVPRGGRLRVEVSLTREVLVLYRHSKVALISHISAGGGYYFRCAGGGTCGPAITPDGNYRARWLARGWLQVPLGDIYNPVFFVGSLFAIHGDIPVPLRPASHGCVRIPMDIARFFYQRIRISQADGTPIYIRGHAIRGRAPGT